MLISLCVSPWQKFAASFKKLSIFFIVSKNAQILTVLDGKGRIFEYELALFRQKFTAGFKKFSKMYKWNHVLNWNSNVFLIRSKFRVSNYEFLHKHLRYSETKNQRKFQTILKNSQMGPRNWNSLTYRMHLCSIFQ